MRRRGLQAIGGILLLGGLTTLGIGLAPLVAPPAAQAEAHDLLRSWPSPTGPSTGVPPVTTRPADNTAFAILRIPRFGAGWSRVVAEGVSAPEVLDTGAVGHYPATAMPGDLGNFAIAGHREAAGGVLLRLPELRTGDQIIVDTATARYVYRVTWVGIVPPSDTAVIAPVPGHPGRAPARRLITIQTCTPPLIDTDRYIVRGELTSWAAR